MQKQTEYKIEPHGKGTMACFVILRKLPNERKFKQQYGGWETQAAAEVGVQIDKDVRAKSVARMREINNPDVVYSETVYRDEFKWRVVALHGKFDTQYVHGFARMWNGSKGFDTLAEAIAYIESTPVGPRV